MVAEVRLIQVVVPQGLVVQVVLDLVEGAAEVEGEQVELQVVPVDQGDLD